MTWSTIGAIIVALLNVASSLVVWLRQKNALDIARDQEIARASLAILELTREGQALRDRVTALSDPEAEELWNRMVKG